MEIKKDVKQIMIDFQCPKCKEGYLRPTGQVFTTNPPMIPHMCNKIGCDYGETFRDKSYPRI